MIQTLLLLPILTLQQPEQKPEKPNPAGSEITAARQAELEAKFQGDLSGVVLEGSYTVVDQKQTDGEIPIRKDKYTITKVQKLKGKAWLFFARVQYGEKDVTVPLPLRVEWAGDTPVISLTNLALPLLGTYTARVVIYDNAYAGTWSGGTHGGHLWGSIIKIPQEDKTDSKSTKDAEKKDRAVRSTFD